MKIILNLSYFSSLNFVWSVKFVLSISFIFEISKNYMIVLLKVMSRKHVSKISKIFTCKHKINESSAEIPTHYWIVWLYSKNVYFYVFIHDKYFNFFRNMFNTKTFLLQNKAIQCVPTSAYFSRFITYALSFIFLGRLLLEWTPLNLGSFW